MTPHLDAPRAKSWPVTTKNGAAGKFTERLRFVTPAQPFGILGVVLGGGRFTLASRLAKPAISTARRIVGEQSRPSLWVAVLACGRPFRAPALGQEPVFFQK